MGDCCRFGLASFGFVLGRFAKAHRRTFSSKPSSGRNDGNRRWDCGVTMNRMACRKALSPWRVSAFAIALLLPTATRSPAYQQPVQQSDQRNANDPNLTAAEEKD